MALSCLERALSLSSDEAMADVWYNIGQVAIGIGDLGLAYQARTHTHTHTHTRTHTL